MKIEDFYTYIYYDPSRNNEPIYIGKGGGKRVWSHLSSKQQTPFVYRLRYMKKNDIVPIIGIYAGLDEEFAHLLEMELIAKFGRKDLGKGPLLNLTDGGEGQTGMVHTVETRKKMSKSHIGIMQSEETRRKISIGNKDKPKTEEHKIKLAIANTGKRRGPTPDEIKKKISIANTGKVRSEETLIKMSISQTGSNNPNFGKKRSEETKLKSRIANQGLKRTEEQKQRMSEAQKKRFTDPKQREQISKTKQEINATSRANNV
jgi:hypothetical protein